MASDHEGGVTVLALVGDLDGAHLLEFGRQLDGLIADGARKFVLHCDRLTSIGSAGLGFLLRVVKRVQPDGGGVVVAEPGSRLLWVMDLMGLMDVFPVFKGVEAGVLYWGDVR